MENVSAVSRRCFIAKEYFNNNNFGERVESYKSKYRIFRMEPKLTGENINSALS